MKNIRLFLSENFHFLVVKFSVYLNRHVFVMSNLSGMDAFSSERSLSKLIMSSSVKRFTLRK